MELMNPASLLQHLQNSFRLVVPSCAIVRQNDTSSLPQQRPENSCSRNSIDDSGYISEIPITYTFGIAGGPWEGVAILIVASPW